MVLKYSILYYTILYHVMLYCMIISLAQDVGIRKAPIMDPASYWISSWSPGRNERQPGSHVVLGNLPW